MIQATSFGRGAGAIENRGMQSYLPPGVLDTFVAEYLRSDALGEPSGRIELAPHRNAKTVYEHRYLGHRIISKVYDDEEDGASAYQVWRVLVAGLGQPV